MESIVITIAGIIVSGIVSVVVSHIYFYKANRNGLEMNVILPMIKMLKSEDIDKIFKHIQPYAESYYLRYFRKKERKAWAELYLKVGELIGSNAIGRIANIIDIYFEEKLEENGIGKSYCPLYDEDGEIVDEYEDYAHHLANEILFMHNLENELKKKDIMYQEEESEKVLIDFFDWCCEQVYDGIKIEYFKDKSLSSIVGESTVTKEWNEKIYSAHKAREKFLDLKICKEIRG